MTDHDRSAQIDNNDHNNSWVSLTNGQTHTRDEEKLWRRNQNLSQAKSQDYWQLSSYISSHIKQGGFPWFYDTNMCRKSILGRSFLSHKMLVL